MGMKVQVLSDHDEQVKSGAKYSALASINDRGELRLMDRQNREVLLNTYETEELIAFLATNYPSPMFRPMINGKAKLPGEND